MDNLLPLAEKIAARLIERKETLATAEGSAGGLISAALLAIPGASAYFVGGAVVYTGAARGAFADVSLDEMKAKTLRPARACKLAANHKQRWGKRHAPAAHSPFPRPARCVLRCVSDNRANRGKPANHRNHHAVRYRPEIGIPSATAES